MDAIDATCYTVVLDEMIEKSRPHDLSTMTTKNKLFPITQRFEITPTLRRVRHHEPNKLISESTLSRRSSTHSRHRLVLNTPFSSRSTISYGLIVYAKDTKRWAIIQRKHSIEFLLFIRGLYRLTYLPLLLSQITEVEANIIRKCLDEGPSTFTKVYLEELDLDNKGLNYALIRMAESRDIAMKLLSRLDLSQNQLAWTWPKGRQSYTGNSDTFDRETPFLCAKREFTEEVEINLPPPLFISDSYLSTNFHSLTGRNVESRFWIYVIPNEIPIPPVEFHPEVSNRLWADAETCTKLIHNDTLFNQVIAIISTIDHDHQKIPLSF
jgi:hypothetical protein